VAEHPKESGVWILPLKEKLRWDVGMSSVCRRNEDPSTFTRYELADLGGV